MDRRFPSLALAEIIIQQLDILHAIDCVVELRVSVVVECIVDIVAVVVVVVTVVVVVRNVGVGVCSCSSACKRCWR